MTRHFTGSPFIDNIHKLQTYYNENTHKSQMIKCRDRQGDKHRMHARHETNIEDNEECKEM